MKSLGNLLASQTYWPVIGSLLMLVWMVIVSPYTKYGDSWATSPIIVIFLAIVVLHLAILIRESWGAKYIVYAAAHVPIAFMIGIYCLARISKDSL